MAELRHAWRQLRRAPGFAVTAVVTLSLTVGLAATAFSVFDALLVRPLPFADPDRIVELDTHNTTGYSQPASWSEYQYWKANDEGFSALAGYSTAAMNFRGPDGPAPVRAMHTTSNFFEVFGVKPVLGRVFEARKDERSQADEAVLSYSAWRKLFGGRADVLGARVELDGFPMTVIGVMPAGFRVGRDVAAYTTYRGADAWGGNDNNHFMPTVARLKPGVTLEQAEAESTRMLAGYARVNPDGKGRKMLLRTMPEALLGETRGMVEVLVGAVLVILALGCVNVAGLMLVRGLKRERELALRAALGASRGRLAAGLGAEIVLLAVAGTAGGGACAWVLLHAVRALLVASLERGADVALNPVVMGAALLAALMTLAVAGLLPLRQLLAVAPGGALRAGGLATGVGREQQRLGAAFIAVQMALAMVLLATSGLLLRSLAGLRGTELGFRADHLAVEDVNLSPASIAGKDPMVSFYRPAMERVRAVPGVESAGLVNLFPVQDSGFNGDVQIVGKPAPPPDRQILAEDRFVDGGYFKAMGTRLVRGRLLDDALDTVSSERVIVVNEAFVRKFFSPGEDPLGRQISNWGRPRIVGVVADMRQSLYQKPMAEIDFPLEQIPNEYKSLVLQEMQLVVRAGVSPRSLAEPLRHALQSVDSGLPFRPLQTMDDVMDDQLTMQRMESWLFGTFAVLAALLAVVGLYGLVAQYVEQGRRGMGVRMALGAQRWQVLASLMRRVGAVSGLGVLAGLAGSFALRRVIGSVVGVHGGGEVWFVLVLTVALEGAALAAAMGPARQAARVEPVEVLRAE